MTACEKHSVSLWCSHPEEGNDDCNTGEEYSTAEEARAVFNILASGGVPEGWKPRVANDFAYLMLDGSGMHEPEYFKNPHYKHTPDDFSLDRHEAQMQAAMAHGTQGWNDFEGM